jgi:hypothetical protein
MYFKSHALVLYYEYSDNNWFAHKGNTHRKKFDTREV